MKPKRPTRHAYRTNAFGSKVLRKGKPRTNAAAKRKADQHAETAAGIE